MCINFIKLKVSTYNKTKKTLPRLLKVEDVLLFTAKINTTDVSGFNYDPYECSHKITTQWNPDGALKHFRWKGAIMKEEKC